MNSRLSPRLSPRFFLAAALLLVFGTYTVSLVFRTGYTGFLTLAAREPWGLQMLLDVTVSIGLFVLWMWPDARRRGIPRLPYTVACILLGSVGALAYLVHRELRPGPTT